MSENNMDQIDQVLSPNNVYLAAGEGKYSAREFEAPELGSEVVRTSSLFLLRQLMSTSKLDSSRFGTRDWNPLGSFILPGSTVLLKPNWVIHENIAGFGNDCVVTHNSVIEAVLAYACKAKPDHVIIADAPVQGCDFEQILTRLSLDTLARAFSGDTRITVSDLRMVRRDGTGNQPAVSNLGRKADDYVLFDLGRESALEPVSGPTTRFRVTMYNPSAVEATHCPGRHQYLVARELLDAAVVINLPKLKTHRKACLTGALKNFVGVNGHKSYLPHHRLGGSDDAGDCYPRSSYTKAAAEALLDSANQRHGYLARSFLFKAATATLRMAKFASGNRFFEGSWYGNDTIWRTVLDLNRIAYFGLANGQLSTVPARHVLNITDAIIAGEGEGPLEPSPAPLGILTMAASSIAADWAHAILMGLDPARLPIIRELLHLRAPLPQALDADRLRVITEAGSLDAHELAETFPHSSLPPSGWVGHCELDASLRSTVC